MTHDLSIETALRVVIGLLADGEYEVLESMTQRRHLSASEIRETVESYGLTLARPDNDVLPADLEVTEVGGQSRRRLAVVFSLTTKEEGLSDLRVELTLVQVAPGLWMVELNNIHVL